jgi:hypothetical protein
MSISRIVPAALALLVGLAATADAQRSRATHHRYVGIHPIAESAGGGVCHIEVPHVHVYQPARVDVQYRVHDGWHHFVGDPVAFGYDGPRTSYHGAHPIPLDVVAGMPRERGPRVEYCYLKGPHHHAYAPAVDTDFVVRGDVHWYVGTFPPAFERERARRAQINVIYEPLVYARPVVEVGPPPGYVDVLVVAPAVVVETPAVIVEAPPVPRGHAGVSVEVHVPVPTIEVGIGVGVGVGHVHGHPGSGKKYKKHKKHKRYDRRHGR